MEGKRWITGIAIKTTFIRISVERKNLCCAFIKKNTCRLIYLFFLFKQQLKILFLYPLVCSSLLPDYLQRSVFKKWVTKNNKLGFSAYAEIVLFEKKVFYLSNELIAKWGLDSLQVINNISWRREDNFRGFLFKVFTSVLHY